MTVDEYKAAKTRSGINNAEIWDRGLVISRDQEKAYSSGRTPVPATVAFAIAALVKHIEEGAVELRDVLEQALPDSAVVLSDESLAIEIKFPSGRSVQLQNRGVDMLNRWPIFAADHATRHEALFVRVRNAKGYKWTLWRGDFIENRNLGHFQSYGNAIERPLLLEALKRYA